MHLGDHFDADVLKAWNHELVTLKQPTRWQAKALTEAPMGERGEVGL